MVGSNYLGDIAIDDFSLLKGPCSKTASTSQSLGNHSGEFIYDYLKSYFVGNTHLFYCKSRSQLTHVSTLHTFSLFSGDCNFEKGICNWSNAAPDQNIDIFDWTPNAGRTTSSNTGPTRDHTTGGLYGEVVYFSQSVCCW